jgi:nucleotide-binding universal stress UspA family protein
MGEARRLIPLAVGNRLKGRRMSSIRLAYLPLTSYPESAPAESVPAAVALAASLGYELRVTTFAVLIPRVRVSSALGAILLDVPEMIRTTEENSRAQCRHLQDLVEEQTRGRVEVKCSTREVMVDRTMTAAAEEARYHDLTLLPWAKDTETLRELAQAVIFGAGRPAILVPPARASGTIRHVAIAWDGSRVAARALADAMPLMAADTRVTVLTVQDEKQLAEQSIAEHLAGSLRSRGVDAPARDVSLDDRAIADVLQESALAAGADLLVMGGFGHTRLRDFILGGATSGVFADLRLPVLLSH